MADPQASPSQTGSPCHEPEPSPSTPEKRPTSDLSSPTSSATASTCMTSPCFSFVFGANAEGRKSSAGSSVFDELGDAPVQQLPEMPHLDLTKPSTSPLDNRQSLSYQEALSPRQQSGKRYHSGYLQHRVPMAAGLLKSWKPKYFRLREHGVMCYKTQDASTPLFEVLFTPQSVLVQDHDRTPSNSSYSSGSRSPKTTPKAGEAYEDQTEKRGRTSWPNRTASGAGSMVLILKHVEVVGHQTPAKAVGVPMLLKAENEADHAAWTECLRYMIDARRRALFQAKDEEDMDMTSPTHLLPMLNSLVEVKTFDAFSAKYLLMKEIGEGSFSIVHRAVNRMTGQLCAVKCCKMCPALEEEERLLRTLSHPNVVSLEGVYEREKNLHYVVMDYLKDGDLCDLLIERQRLPEPEARRIIRQVVEGLAYLHRRCVLHRDIKPENILIHGNTVKIADFGLAKELPQPTTKLKRSCGTMEYAAPELLCGRPYGLKSDVFSLGVVLYVLLFGAFPFSVESAAALQCMNHFPTDVDVRDMSCLNRCSAQWRIVSPLAQDVLLEMLRINDTERISAEALLGHPWFDAVDDEMSGSTGSRTPEDFEVARVEDCEELGFAELLSRGFQVVKYGNKESTTPHSTTIGINFMEECITWTSRSASMLSSNRSGNGISGNTKRGRSIPLREVLEIREGHSTDAFVSAARKYSKSMPLPELCLSIVCRWRTLDLVVEAPTQREFMVRGLRRLLPSSSQ
ncbi:Serine/threonine-protein kinase DCLK3 [Phytophthora ramorum]|uniref:Protein kinase domain-containing protein n=1 Tax=Phytophthora ramorum TaxID=164328 RepID=H3GUK5_PHYRM|nr:Serine/threonine-protein kinase DCLK3 [Phytophthora ramorum]